MANPSQAPAANGSRNMVLRILRRRFWIILLCAIVAPVVAYVVSDAQTRMYQSSASLLFRDAGFDEQLLGSPLPYADPTRAAATNLRLISLGVVAERTQLRLPPDVGSVSEAVAVAAEGNADLISITATHRDPAIAARIANTFADEFIAFRREGDRAAVREADRLVRRQLAALGGDERDPQVRSLQERLEELRIFAALQTGNAELVQKARPASVPTSPRPRRNAMIGGFLGLLLGLAMAFAVERLDRRIREADEAERIFGRPVIGAIPNDTDLPKQHPGPMTYEAFSLLRANLRYLNVDEPVRSVFVTSAGPGDGKSTVSWHLATASAASGIRTLLIEVDLRQPKLAERTGTATSYGLSDVLADVVDSTEAVQTLVVGRGGDDAPRLDVLFAGRTPPNPTDLLGSKRMEELLRRAESEYDFVVIDTPPPTIVSDPIPLIRQVTGALVVVRVGKTTRDAAGQLAAQLDQLGGRVLGIVANGVRNPEGAGDYAYRYAYAAAAHPNGDGAATGKSGALSRLRR